MASSGTTSTHKRFTGAEFIVHFLEQQGIKIVTGIPGGSILPVYDALSQSTQIRHILARHEQGAGFIAQGMARTDGKPAVCMACSGPLELCEDCHPADDFISAAEPEFLPRSRPPCTRRCARHHARCVGAPYPILGFVTSCRHDIYRRGRLRPD